MSKEENTKERGVRKERNGIVTGDKMDKTIIVTVHSKVRHAKFKKVIDVSKKFYVHDENNSAKIGDKVTIVETRPLSKKKRWRLVSVQEA